MNRLWLLASLLPLTLGPACSCGVDTPAFEDDGGLIDDAGPGADGGPEDDAGAEDAGAEDAGAEDAGSGDGGTDDTSDAGAVDAGPDDAGTDDAGSEDAGPVDAGPVANTCAAAAELSSGTSVSGTTTDGEDLFAGGCLGSGAPEAVYTYTVAAPTAEVVVELLDTDGDDLGFYVRTDCVDESSEATCQNAAAAGEAERWTSGILTQGTRLSVFVDGSDGNDVGPFDLTVSETELTLITRGEECDPTSGTVICDARQGDLCLSDGDGSFSCYGPAENDVCAEATALDGDGTALGQLDSATADYDAADAGNCTGGATTGADVVYSVSIPDGQTLSATLDTEAGDAALYLLDECPPDADACLAGAEANNAGVPETVSYANSAGAAQTVFIVVDTVAGSGGFFSLDYEVATPTLILTEIVEHADRDGLTYVELYNATSGTVDLDDYELRLYTNGSATPTATIELPNQDVGPGNTFVIANNTARYFAEFFTAPGHTSGDLEINGNDVVELYNAERTARVDIYGGVGENPLDGESWSYAASVAKRRLSRIAGDTDFEAGDWVITAGAAQARPGSRD